MSALTAKTQAATAQSNVLFLTQTQGVANMFYLTFLKGSNHSIHAGCPQYDGDMVHELSRTAGYECDLILVIARYPIDLYPHDNIPYQPPFIIERLVNSYTPFPINP